MKGDFYFCLDLNRFDFVLQATRVEDGVMQLLPLRKNKTS